jgi:hypothetical protein
MTMDQDIGGEMLRYLVIELILVQINCIQYCRSNGKLLFHSMVAASTPKSGGSKAAGDHQSVAIWAPLICWHVVHQGQQSVGE